MICSRCQTLDGREVREYKLKDSTRAFCLECASITARFHDISPQPQAQEVEAVPEPEAEAEDEPEPEPEAQEAEEPAPTRRRRRRH